MRYYARRALVSMQCPADTFGQRTRCDTSAEGGEDAFGADFGKGCVVGPSCCVSAFSVGRNVFGKESLLGEGGIHPLMQRCSCGGGISHLGPGFYQGEFVVDETRCGLSE